MTQQSSLLLCLATSSPLSCLNFGWRWPSRFILAKQDDGQAKGKKKRSSTISWRECGFIVRTSGRAVTRIVFRPDGTPHLVAVRCTWAKAKRHVSAGAKLKEPRMPHARELYRVWRGVSKPRQWPWGVRGGQKSVPAPLDSPNMPPPHVEKAVFYPPVSREKALSTQNDSSYWHTKEEGQWGVEYTYQKPRPEQL